MTEEKNLNQDCELTDDELDSVAGGGLLEPILTRREGLVIQTDTFPRAESFPIPLGGGFGLKD